MVASRSHVLSTSAPVAVPEHSKSSAVVPVQVWPSPAPAATLRVEPPDVDPAALLMSEARLPTTVIASLKVVGSATVVDERVIVKAVVATQLSATGGSDDSAVYVHAPALLQLVSSAVASEPLMSTPAHPEPSGASTKAPFVSSFALLFRLTSCVAVTDVGAALSTDVPSGDRVTAPPPDAVFNTLPDASVTSWANVTPSAATVTTSVSPAPGAILIVVGDTVI